MSIDKDFKELCSLWEKWNDGSAGVDDFELARLNALVIQFSMIVSQALSNRLLNKDDK